MATVTPHTSYTVTATTVAAVPVDLWSPSGAKCAYFPQTLDLIHGHHEHKGETLNAKAVKESPEERAQAPAMSNPFTSRYCSLLLTLLIFLTSFASKTLASETPLSFTFDLFHKNDTMDSAIALYGDAVVEDSAVRITRAGKILYRKPLKFLRGNPGFSTYFCFYISPSGANNLAFFLDSADWRRFHLSKNVLLLDFSSNASGSHIGIRVGRELNGESCSLSAGDVVVSSGSKLHSWVEYDGFSKRIEVRLSKFRALRPASPFISCPVDISSVLQKEALLVGISSSSDFSTSTKGNSTYIYSWSFVVKHGAPYLMHSEPLDPRSYLVASHDEARVHLRNSYSRVSVMAWLFGLVCGAMMAFMVLFVRNVLCCRSLVAAVEYPVHPVEVDYEKSVIVGEKGGKAAPS